jgi:hypothetical protein
MLYGKPWNKAPADKADWLQWFEAADGTRIFLAQGPIKSPKVLHQVWPQLRGMPDSPGDERVMVEFIVGTDGRVRDPRVVAHQGNALMASSLTAIQQTTYQPASLDGTPVPVISSSVFSIQSR